MIVFLSGGVRSGKSKLAEEILSNLPYTNKIYLATSRPIDKEIRYRIDKHRNDRKNKQFTTIEKSENISAVIPGLKANDTVLLDCLGNLLANEMYSDLSTVFSKKMILRTVEKIFSDIEMIRKKVHTLVIVSNEIFSDGIKYAEDAEPYLYALAALHIRIAKMSNVVIECVHGSNIIYKNEMTEFKMEEI